VISFRPKFGMRPLSGLTNIARVLRPSSLSAGHELRKLAEWRLPENSGTPYDVPRACRKNSMFSSHTGGLGASRANFPGDASSASRALCFSLIYFAAATKSSSTGRAQHPAVADQARFGASRIGDGVTAQPHSVAGASLPLLRRALRHHRSRCCQGRYS
jgi:hypothetical protein